MIRKLALVSLVAAVPIAVLCSDAAHACIMVAHGPPPKLDGERVLIVFDEEKSLEHFVREIRVDKVSEDFGFVVPVPSEPEVAKAPNIFDALEKEFPVTTAAPMAGATGHGGLKGMRGLDRAAPVEVVAEAKIGSFTATTLKASETAALEKWLTERKFTLGPSGATWLKHYVLRSAYFVAFKFDAKAAAGGAMKSEAVRISFKTAHPFYPYLEPEGPAPAERKLGVWFTAANMHAPRANLVSADGTMKLVDPWTEMGRKSNVENRVKRVLGGLGGLASVLPNTPLVMQSFVDRRTVRSGLGDVMMLSEAPREISSDLVKRSALFLDPSAIPGELAVTVKK